MGRWPCVQVGCPEHSLEDEEILHAEQRHQPVHLLQGHRDSYLHFMRRNAGRGLEHVGTTISQHLPLAPIIRWGPTQRHLFAKELEKMQEHIQLTGDSLVLVSEEKSAEQSSWLPAMA